jgi:uncharacterized membrane protein YozB (DUF420 family)
MTVQDLPVINASLNALASALLVAAFVSIKLRKVRLHAWLMIGAVATSALFLASYLTYHFNSKPKSIGLEPGAFRTAYFVMLISHTVLAVLVLPMILMTLWRAYRRQWVQHHRIATPTFWIWIYVSITGVLIYLVLYHMVPSLYPNGPAAAAGVTP